MNKKYIEDRIAEAIAARRAAEVLGTPVPTFFSGEPDPLADERAILIAANMPSARRDAQAAVETVTFLYAAGMAFD